MVECVIWIKGILLPYQIASDEWQKALVQNSKGFLFPSDFGSSWGSGQSERSGQGQAPRRQIKRVPVVRLYRLTLPLHVRLTSRSVHATRRSISLATEYTGAVGEILGYQFWQGPQAAPKMDPLELATLTPNAEVTMSLPITWSLMDILVYSGLFQTIFKPLLSVTWAAEVNIFSWQNSRDFSC